MFQYTNFIRALEAINPSAHLSIADHLTAIFSPNFREKRLKQERDAVAAIRKANWEQEVEAAKQFNVDLLISIISNCPADHLVMIDFPCGNWSAKALNDEVPHLVEVASKIEADTSRCDFWAYCHGGGRIVINPDPYLRLPGRIADAIWTPNRFLRGNRIKAWKYLPKVRTE